MKQDRPTRNDANLWALEKKELELDIKWYQRMIRQNLREAWSTFRGVFPEEALATPWLPLGENETAPDYRGMLKRMVMAADLEIRDDGRVGSISYPDELRKMFLEAYLLLRDNE